MTQLELRRLLPTTRSRIQHESVNAQALSKNGELCDGVSVLASVFLSSAETPQHVGWNQRPSLSYPRHVK